VLPGDRQRVPVAGGVLVYESRELGRELVGFENVQDWDDVADQVTADLCVKTPEHTPLSEHEPHATLQATEDGVTVTIDLDGPGLQQLAAAVQAAEGGDDADV